MITKEERTEWVAAMANVEGKDFETIQARLKPLFERNPELMTTKEWCSFAVRNFASISK